MFCSMVFTPSGANYVKFKTNVHTVANMVYIEIFKKEIIDKYQKAMIKNGDDDGDREASSD